MQGRNRSWLERRLADLLTLQSRRAASCNPGVHRFESFQRISSGLLLGAPISIYTGYTDPANDDATNALPEEA